nr:glycosyltransferase family 4 protein [Cryobacterium arcticum]
MPNRDSNSSPPRIVSVGRLVPKKGHAILIRAFGEVIKSWPDAELSIVGDGPQRQELEGLIDELGLSHQVKLLGSMPSKEVAIQMGLANIFALACVVDSTGDADGLPVAFLEAGASALPIVGCLVSGVGEFLSEETSWLAESGSVRDLADKLCAAISDPLASRERAHSAWQLVGREFSIESQIAGLRNVIESATAVRQQ